MRQERTIKLQDNLRLCEAGTEKGSRNGGHREECLGEVCVGGHEMGRFGKS